MSATAAPRLVRTARLRVHAAAALVPEMGAEEWAAFKADVALRGILEPVEVVTGNRVVDGRHRLRAAVELELPQVPVRTVAPADLVEYVLLAATRRRHLNAGQLAAVAVELELHRDLLAVGKQRKQANLRVAPASRSAPSKTRSPSTNTTRRCSQR